MCSLDREDRQLLLDLARSALISAVKGAQLPNLPEDKLPKELGGAFVTLHRRGRLRGCVGEIDAKEPLVTVITRCSRAAALDDPRFDPVQPAELAEIDIEISILSAPQVIKAELIEPGKHGLIVSRDYRRGVLLPQVAKERGWAAERFLEETCVKAGLERDAWKNGGTTLEAFTAEIFGELELAQGSIDDKSPRTSLLDLDVIARKHLA
jgi:AmmeMemoRadiSam system protein A